MCIRDRFTEGEVVYTKEEAAQHFRDQDAATHLPYIYLSAGVSAELFQETLTFAHDAGAHFNGVLCLSLIHISEPTRPLYISYAVFCLKKKKNSFFFFFLMLRRPTKSTLSSSSAASDVYKRQIFIYFKKACLF